MESGEAGVQLRHLTNTPSDRTASIIRSRTLSELRPLVWITAKYLVVDESREWSFAVEVDSVVVVGDYDGDEAEQQSNDHVEVWTEVWRILLYKCFVVFFMLWLWLVVGI
jgi:hypothetical protein